MANILNIRNPKDLTSTYSHIEIYSDDNASMSSPTLLDTVAINTATASDLSTGYTSYTDENGDDSTYYKFRYKVGSAYSSYSEIFQAGTSIMHTRFRKKMKDTNSANYYFSNEEIDEFLTGAISRLFPHTYNEVIDESLTSAADTEKYSFPVGINRVTDLEFLNSDGSVAFKAPGYNIRARQIIFDDTPPSGYTIRIYGDKMFKAFEEIPEFLDDLILDLMRMQAYETFEADRSKYYKYTTAVNPEGGNLPSIASIIERLELTTQRRLNALRRIRRASEIKLI